MNRNGRKTEEAMKIRWRGRWFLKLVSPLFKRFVWIEAWCDVHDQWERLEVRDLMALGGIGGTATAVTMEEDDA